MSESVKSLAAQSLIILSVATGAVCGCASVHVGMGIPVPGPVKPSVGVTVDKSGVKGTGGVSAKAGSVPIYAGGTTKPISTATSEQTKQK